MHGAPAACAAAARGHPWTVQGRLVSPGCPPGRRGAPAIAKMSVRQDQQLGAARAQIAQLQVRRWAIV